MANLPHKCTTNVNIRRLGSKLKTIGALFLNAHPEGRRGFSFSVWRSSSVQTIFIKMVSKRRIFFKKS
jgi:hypothetical protein